MMSGNVVLSYPQPSTYLHRIFRVSISFTCGRCLYSVRASSIRSRSQIHRFGISIDTLTSENDQFCQKISDRMAGVESRLEGLIMYIQGSPVARAYASKHHETQTHPDLGAMDDGNPVDQAPPVIGFSDTVHVFPTVQFQTLRRRPCDPICHCPCHKTQRFTSSGFLEGIFGNLFLGYAGLPSVFRKCTVLGCHQESPKLAKMTYRFPYWFWQRAISIGFSHTYATGPELLLRFPCVRPVHCEWFHCARLGSVKGLKYLLDNKQAGGMLRRSRFSGPARPADHDVVHDVDEAFGLTALHVSERTLEMRSMGLL